jgi:hypothetical protein
VDRNHFASALRIFKFSKETMGFPPIEEFLENFGRILSSLYIFKFFHPQNDGYTHAIYIRLTAYAHRGTIERFLQETLAVLTGSKVETRAVVPYIKKDTSLFDYL